MRIRSLSPEYLDVKWLVALRREGLLARNVLLGNTKWYRNHSQLIRFKEQKSDSLLFLDTYLKNVYLEACERWYHFDESKIWNQFTDKKIKVTSWQIAYERKHLMSKLKNRDEKIYKRYITLDEKKIRPFWFIRELWQVRINNIFDIVDWEIESWEKI